MAKTPAERAATYRKAHPDRLISKEDKSTYDRAYYQKNAAKIQAYGHAYRRANKAKKAAQDRAYRLKHPEKVSQYSRAAYRRDPAKRAAMNASYRARHPEMAREASKRRRALKKGAAICDFTAAQWAAMKDRYGHRCVYCGRKMKRLEQDHIIPLSKGGNHTYSNIVPACRSCNAKKYAGAVLCQIQPLLLLG